MARSTLPAETQEIACSVLRPPKTTATRVLPGAAGTGADPTGRRSAGVGTHRADVVGPERAGDAHVAAGVGRLDHPAVADVDGDVVDGVGIGRVGREEHQVARLQLAPVDVPAGVPLRPGPVVEVDAGV